MHFKENLVGVGGTSTETTAESLPPAMSGVLRNPEILVVGKTCFTAVPHLSGASSPEFLTNLWGKDKIIKGLTLGCELLPCALSSAEQKTCKCQSRYLLVGADTLQLPSKCWENIPHLLRLLKLQQIELGQKKKKSSPDLSALIAVRGVMRWAVLVFPSWFCPTFLSPPARAYWFFPQSKLFPGCYRVSGKLDLYSNEYWPESKIMGTLLKKIILTFSPSLLTSCRLSHERNQSQTHSQTVQMKKTWRLLCLLP